MRIEREYTNIFSVVIIGVMGFVVGVSVVSAAVKDITFPVAELGGCKSEAACKTYCNAPANMPQCVAFAERHGLMSKRELDTAKKFMQSGGGPGNCRTREECFTYCDDVAHINECVAYGKKTGIMTAEELREAEQIQSALSKGAKLPGGCRGKESCDTYCNNPTHMEECVAFAEAAGFMDAGELQEAKKVMAAMKKGAKPPPCRGKRECDEYCTRPENMEACFTFAEAAGLLDGEELDEMKKVMAALKKGVKLPGGCRDKRSCEAYCEDPAHQDECMEFAIAAGFMSQEDLEQMEEGRNQARAAIEDAPDEVRACLDSALGKSTVEGILAGTARPSERMGRAMDSCYREFEKTQRRGEDEEYYQGDGGYYEEDGGGYGEEHEDEYYEEDFENEEFGGNILDKARAFLKKLLGR